MENQQSISNRDYRFGAGLLFLSGAASQ